MEPDNNNNFEISKKDAFLTLVKLKFYEHGIFSEQEMKRALITAMLVIAVLLYLLYGVVEWLI